MDINEKIALGERLHAKGYNCAQSVLLANADDLGIDHDAATMMAAGFGGGVGGQGQICGVASALAIAQGFIAGPDPAKKPEVYRGVRSLCDSFVKNNGHLTCRELKSPPQRISCDCLIADGIRILHDYIHAHK